MRRIPIIPTLLVLFAVGIMVRLGFWQLDRLKEKEVLMARYERAQRSDVAMNWPRSAAEVPQHLFHQSRINCLRVVSRSTFSGRNLQDIAGITHRVNCDVGNGATVDVVLGWSSAVIKPDWAGGEVSGWIAPGPRLVADPPLAGLQPNAAPDPSAIPNNHLSYAVQWFLFAGVALVIYGLALRQRWRERMTRTGSSNTRA